MEAKALFTLLLLSLLSIDGYSVTFNYLNQCVHSVWIAASPGIGVTMPEYGPDTLTIFDTPDAWSGMIWVRTQCTTSASNWNRPNRMPRPTADLSGDPTALHH
ncbi:hypothetical protein CK203_009395 [Vitis vinifera]|uniref:Uncharacterized protein n=1 Tax=Vitis vinifera TaxID=29760 RepID=A0A438JSR4_VITVI|nr:hypothetical protein CK203_009395 [Vitis vinifera]